MSDPQDADAGAGKKRTDARATARQIRKQVGGLKVADPGGLQQWVLGATAALQWCLWAKDGFIPPVEMLRVAKDMQKAGKRARRQR